MSFKGVRSFCREISSIFVSMTNRANNIMLLNTPARARLITSVGILPCAATFIANVANGNNGFLNTGKKKFRTILSTYHSSLISSILPPPPPSLPLFLNSLVSNIHKYTCGSSVKKRRKRSPLRWRNHCLRSNVYGNTHRTEIEDAMSDPARGPPQDMRATFDDVDVEHIREKKTPTVGLEISYTGISIANLLFFFLFFSFLAFHQFANFQIENKRDVRATFHRLAN